MNVSIIIVNYNTKDLLHNCIKSIYDKTQDLAFEVIVVDNASTDGSQQMILDDFPKVVLVASLENLGFGKANNLGVAKSNGDYLFFLNSDTILLNNAVKIFYDFFESTNNKGFSIAGSVLLNSDLVPVHSSGRFPSRYGILKEVFDKYTKGIKPNISSEERFTFDNDCCFEVDYITGADLFIKKKVFNLVGGFDPDFFMYYEDSDFQKRMQKLGFPRILINGPKIIHLEGGSNTHPVFSAKRTIMITTGMYKYFKKHSSLLGFLVFKISYFTIRLPILFDRRIKFKERINYLYSLIN